MGGQLDAAEEFGGGRVNDFEGVVAEGGDKEALALGVDGEVVEAAFDARQGDGLHELQVRGVRGLSGNGEGGEHGEEERFRCVHSC